MKFVHHIDGDLTNNHPSNLELRSSSYMKTHADVKAFLDRVVAARPQLPDEPRHIVIKSRLHEEDVAGVIMMEDEPIKFITKIVVKPKVDWLALNREMSNF